MKDFPQFAGPWMKTFWYFPLPLDNAVNKALQNISLGMWCRCSNSSAAVTHLPSHPSVHSPAISSCNNSMRLFLERLYLDSASANSFASCSASSTALFPLFAMNSAKELFPSRFCTTAKWTSSTREVIDFAWTSWHTSNTLRRSDLLSFSFLSLYSHFVSLSFSCKPAQILFSAHPSHWDLGGQRSAEAHYPLW